MRDATRPRALHAVRASCLVPASSTGTDRRSSWVEHRDVGGLDQAFRVVAGLGSRDVATTNAGRDERPRWGGPMKYLSDGRAATSAPSESRQPRVAKVLETDHEFVAEPNARKNRVDLCAALSATSQSNWSPLSPQRLFVLFDRVSVRRRAAPRGDFLRSLLRCARLSRRSTDKGWSGERFRSSYCARFCNARLRLLESVIAKGNNAAGQSPVPIEERTDARRSLSRQSGCPSAR